LKIENCGVPLARVFDFSVLPKFGIA